MTGFAERWEPLSSEPLDWDRFSSRNLFRLGLWTLLILAVPSLWLLARYRVVSDYAWALSTCILLLAHLRLWYSSVRRERVLLMAYVEMSDLHLGYVRAVREAYQEDPAEVWLLSDDEPEKFWSDLVDTRTSEMLGLGVAPLSRGEVALTLQAGSRYVPW